MNIPSGIGCFYCRRDAKNGKKYYPILCDKATANECETCGWYPPVDEQRRKRLRAGDFTKAVDGTYYLKVYKPKAGGAE